jgi:hypothetical protein
VVEELDPILQLILMQYAKVQPIPVEEGVEGVVAMPKERQAALG